MKKLTNLEAKWYIRLYAHKAMQGVKPRNLRKNARLFARGLGKKLRIRLFGDELPF